MIDYYKILDIPRDATPMDIKTAYRKLAKEYHPDKCPDEDQERISAKFKEITDAYRILGDEDKRADYDSKTNPDEAATILKNTFKREKKKKYRVGSDLIVSISVSLKDVAYKAIKNTSIERKGHCSICGGTGSETRKMKTCPMCKGAGSNTLVSSVIHKNKYCATCSGYGDIPERICQHCAGTGLEKEVLPVKIQLSPLMTDYMVFHEYGNYSVGGGIPGDLIVNINMRPDPIYSLNGRNIKRIVEISPAKAVLGGSISCDFFGRIIEIDIPSRTSDGAIIRKEYAGIVHNGKTGDFIATVKIKLPLKLNSEENSLYKKLLELEGNHG